MCKYAMYSYSSEYAQLFTVQIRFPQEFKNTIENIRCLQTIYFSHCLSKVSRLSFLFLYSDIFLEL